MNRGFPHVCCLVIALLAAALLAGAAQAAEQVTVPKVLKVDFDKNKDVVMEVTGEVPTGGFKDPMLIQVAYVRQPDDGIQDFNFVATKPEGIVTQAVTKISARHVWKGGIPAWIKGVRIHGAGDGIKTVKLER